MFFTLPMEIPIEWMYFSFFILRFTFFNHSGFGFAETKSSFYIQLRNGNKPEGRMYCNPYLQLCGHACKNMYPESSNSCKNSIQP